MVKYKTVFFGTPELAVPFLELLHKNTNVSLVVTQPDRPSGRHLKTVVPPVKLFAQENNLSIIQPVDLKNENINQKIDFGVVVAYGKILPEKILNITAKGLFNVHFSVLPKYRGAAPIQWAIIKGEKVSGVTIFRIEKGMDTGDILVQKNLSIDDEDTADTLETKLVALGVDSLREAIELISNGKTVLQKQVGNITYAPLLKKEDGKICWLKPAQEIHNLVRGTYPWPGAYTVLSTEENKQRKIIKILESKPVNIESNILDNISAGTIVEISKEKGLVVKCGNGHLSIIRLQEEGKKMLSAWEYLQGARMKTGDRME